MNYNKNNNTKCMVQNNFIYLKKNPKTTPKFDIQNFLVPKCFI